MAGKYRSTLEALSRPFIQAGLYESEEDFLRDLVKDLAQRKIKAYQSTVRKYEKRYQSWDRFTEKIKGEATPEQEDEWMEWEAARNMLETWKEWVKELA